MFFCFKRNAFNVFLTYIADVFNIYFVIFNIYTSNKIDSI